MTQVFDEAGVASPATIVRVTPNTVTKIKALEADGYEAVQVATGAQKEQRVSKATKGSLGGAYVFVKEFRPRKHQQEVIDGLEAGQTLDASVFAPGDTVVVSATSKGKGFQGVVKRHGFHGAASKSHGTKHVVRAPGSIGATGPARVFKGTRMAGRMGSDRVTVKNLKVLQVNPKENLLLIKGAIPGRRGSLVEVRSA
jgi:large subunit ribosomal protein L3